MNFKPKRIPFTCSSHSSHENWSDGGGGAGDDDCGDFKYKLKLEEKLYRTMKIKRYLFLQFAKRFSILSLLIEIEFKWYHSTACTRYVTVPLVLTVGGSN